MIHPQTRRGFFVLLAASLALGGLAAWAGSPDNTFQGVVVFIFSYAAGSWIVAAWERRQLKGEGGLPSPIDVAKEPVRATQDEMASHADSPYGSRDRIIQAGVILAFLGAFIGLPLLFGLERPLFGFLGDAQPIVAAGLVIGGLLIVMVRYADRGTWR